MKNILKTLMLSLVVLTVSCENDDKTSVTSPDAPVLLNPANADAFVLRPEKGTDLAATFVWSHADYGVQTAVNYKVEFALAGSDFAAIIDGGSPFNNQKFKSYTVTELNTIAEAAGLLPFQNGDLNVRIKAWLGSNEEMISYSAPITITINRFTNELPKLWVPGKYQATSGYGTAEWSHATAPQLASEAYGKKDYEGYVYISSNQVDPANDGFKISTQANWDGQNFGDDGSFSGMLSASGSNILTNAGYYLITANPYPVDATNANGMKYSVTATNWGIVGNATPGGWDNSTPMTYDPATKKWSITVALSAQTAPSDGWKFRANNSWTLNLGDTSVNSTDGKLKYGGENIGVAAAGNYKIELDLSNPRLYTYTITKL